MRCKWFNWLSRLLKCKENTFSIHAKCEESSDFLNKKQPSRNYEMAVIFFKKSRKIF